MEQLDHGRVELLLHSCTQPLPSMPKVHPHIKLFTAMQLGLDGNKTIVLLMHCKVCKGEEGNESANMVTNYA